MSLGLSKCHIVGNRMSWPICFLKVVILNIKLKGMKAISFYLAQRSGWTYCFWYGSDRREPGHEVQSVKCLATDACLTVDPGVVSSILARSHTFVEIDHEIISTVILLPSADSFKMGCCQLQVKVCA